MYDSEQISRYNSARCWSQYFILLSASTKLQCVPLVTETGISLIILTPMKILQRNLSRSTFVVWEVKRNVSVVRFKFRCNILISGKIINEMPVSVASGTHCITGNEEIFQQLVLNVCHTVRNCPETFNSLQNSMARYVHTCSNLSEGHFMHLLWIVTW